MNQPYHQQPDDPEHHPIIVLMQLEVRRMERIQANVRKMLRVNLLVAFLIVLACAINVSVYLLAIVERIR